MQAKNLSHSRLRTIIIMIVALLLMMAVGSAGAQGTVIAYGSPVFGTLSAEAPLGFFNFNGTAGDLITVRVIGTGGGLDPNVGLLSPTQVSLASNDNDLFSPGSSDASVSLRLPETGVYSLLVGGSNGTTGDFLLRVDAAAPSVSTALSPDTPTVVNIPLGAPSQSFSFNANPGGSTTLNLSTDSPGFGFTAVVRNGAGQIVAILGGDTLQSASLTIGAGSGVYEVAVSSSSPDTQGAVNISLGAGAAASTGQTSSAPPPPAATQEAVAPPPAQTGADPLAGIGANDACTVTPAGGNVNLRAGAGTNFPVQGQLFAGQTANPDGQTFGNDNFIWFRLPSTAWVRSDVVRQAGNCIGLPTVASPAAPAAPPPPPPPAATEETGAPPPPPTQAPPPQDNNQPPTEETQEPPPPTEETPPPNPTAPPDTGQYILEVDRDENTQFSEQVSSPEGDTTDQVFIRITGLQNTPPNSTREFSFTLVCSGSGTELLRWGTGGNLGTNGCGATSTRLFTNDSDTILFTIGFPPGSGPALVNYTIVINKIS
ncbi:MAG: hypothetical protein D6737_08165 [Chloroflexi bacterium]|nr:MAG: hypothetical protein D6737_08165 [Chloroflexota bacterium]